MSTNAQHDDRTRHNDRTADRAMIETGTVKDALRRGGPVRRHAQVTGAFMCVVGLLGLVPGITTDYDRMGLWGSGAQLFGIFTVSVTTTVLLFLFGVTVLVFAGSVRQAHKSAVVHALLLIGMGLTGTGLVNNSPAALLPTDAESNWLYLVLGTVFLISSNRARAKEVEQNGVF